MAGSFGYDFIDVHCHVMPGVDDGSKDEEMTAKMLQLAYSENIRSMILTPHNKTAIPSVSVEGIHKRLPVVERLAREQNLDMHFYTGNELMYDSSLPDRLVDGKCCTLADSHFVLVEFHPSDSFDYIREGLRQIQYNGYSIMLAHVERYICLLKNEGYVEDLINSGIFLQVNAEDVLPKMFHPVPKFVNRLLRDGLVSFVGTDAHRDSGERAPHMMACAEYLVKKYDPDYVKAILHDNAAAVIRDEDFDNYW